nr:caspase 3 [Chrysogorgia stellata]
MGSSHSRLKNWNLRRSSKRSDNDVVSTSTVRPQQTQSKKNTNTINQLYPRLKTPLLKRPAGTESCDGGPVRSYPTDNETRGPVFIINNFAGFDGFEFRRGSSNDVGKLTTVFEELNFTVHECKANCGAEDMKEKCKNWARRDFSNIDCVVVVILTHGGENGLLNGCDNKPVKLSELISPFYADNSPTLIGKPKIFIIQACRGGEYSKGVEEKSDSKTSTASNDRGECLDEDFWESAEHDDRSETNDSNGERASFQGENVSSGFLPRNADVVVAYSCSEGEEAFRNTASGSWYIEALTKVLGRSSKDKMHFTDILTEVQGIISNLTMRRVRAGHNVAYVQMPEFRSTLRGPLYL